MTKELDTDPIRRRLLRTAAASIALPLLPMFSAQAAPLTYDIKPIELDLGVWMIAGAQEAITFENGGAIANITILDSSEGAIIVDTGPSKRFGMQLASLARTLTGKDIARVYLTHFHPDHVFGNQAFDHKQLAATPGLISGLRDMGTGFSDAMYYIARDWMRDTDIVLPSTEVKAGVEDIGGRRLRLMPMAGHTDSDLAIFDESSGILIAGDLAFLDRAPTTPHADIERWLNTLAKLDGIPCNRLVPGHGPAEKGKRAIDQTKEWLAAIEDIISRSFDAGQDILEASAAPLPESLAKIALARYEFGRSVMHIYPKLEAARLPSVGRRAS